MSMSPFAAFQPTLVSGATELGGDFVYSPYVLTDPDTGDILTDADGTVLTYGTARIRVE
jgi:hypothetical protein